MAGEVMVETKKKKNQRGRGGGKEGRWEFFFFFGFFEWNPMAGPDGEERRA